MVLEEWEAQGDLEECLLEVQVECPEEWVLEVLEEWVLEAQEDLVEWEEVLVAVQCMI